MAYLVSITPRAERDLDLIYTNINAEYSPAALKWYRGLARSVLSLEKHPNRCPLTQKKNHIRCLLYGHKPHIYRVIFRILERQEQVEVLHIRHGARRKPKQSDLT
jgi:toxin ParE1/3/4